MREIRVRQGPDEGKRCMDRQKTAETVALDAFLWVAAQDGMMGQFLDASGVPPDDMTHAVGDPIFLGAVLDFLLAEDARVVAFCDMQGLAYTEPMRARMALPGGEAYHWT